MTTRHGISNADELYRGSAYFAPYHTGIGDRTGLLMSDYFQVVFGAPATTSSTAVATAQAVAGAGNLTLDGSAASGGVATFTVVRGVTVKSSDAGDTTQTVTFTGTDFYGQTQTQTVTLNGTSAVNSTKTFKTITQVAVSAVCTGNVSAGNTAILGLPFRVDAKSQVCGSFVDGTNDALTAIVVADSTDPATASTGDVRGTVTFTTSPNGSKLFALNMVRSTTYSKLGQFGVSPV